MKIIAVLLILLAPIAARSQSILNKMKQKTKEAVENRVLAKTAETVNKGLDKAEGKQVEAEEEKNGEESSSSPKNEFSGITHYSRYDFVPGAAVFYYADFEGQAIGELPLGWNSNGSAVVVNLEGINGNWLRLPQGTVSLTDNTKETGTDFTIEFDMVMHFDFNGWIPPAVRFGLLATGEKSASSNELLSNPVGEKSLYVAINPAKEGRTGISMESYEKNTRYFRAPQKSNSAIEKMYGKPMHIAMQAQKERMRVWVNGEKVFDVPKAIPAAHVFNQMYFQLESSAYADEQVNVYASNLKFATGLPDTRHQLVEEGKFSTTGILFERNAASVKPESSGVLAEIAAVLKKYPEINVKIIGHTDADGTEEANLKLSAKRAEAVKEKLEKEYGIAPERMIAEGKGESQPIADNDSDVNKARNRRVEFIKQ